MQINFVHFQSKAAQTWSSSEWFDDGLNHLFRQYHENVAYGSGCPWLEDGQKAQTRAQALYFFISWASLSILEPFYDVDRKTPADNLSFDRIKKLR